MITRACYCTREDVRKALDVKLAAYNDSQIDRNLMSAADSVDQLCKRHFDPQDGTRKFDWPNFQYVYPWVLYLDQHELAAQPTLVVSGSLLPNPVVIPSTNYIMRPVNTGPPFRRIELRRDLNSSFGNNPTPQLDIAITGTFGYNYVTAPATALAAAMLAGDTTAQMSAGVGIKYGVGDTLVVENERMLVTDSFFIATNVAWTGGVVTASANDNTMTGITGTLNAGEVIQIDSEWMLVLAVLGTTAIVKRAWAGSILSTHLFGTVSAQRLINVTRGVLGTTAAAHNNGIAASKVVYPGLVQELAVAEAVIGLTQEPSAYAFDLEARSRMTSTVYGGTGHGQQREPAVGIGITDLRDRTASAYGRQMRTRVV